MGEFAHLSYPSPSVLFLLSGVSVRISSFPAILPPGPAPCLPSPSFDSTPQPLVLCVGIRSQRTCGVDALLPPFFTCGKAIRSQLSSALSPAIIASFTQHFKNKLFLLYGRSNRISKPESDTKLSFHSPQVYQCQTQILTLSS